MMTRPPKIKKLFKEFYQQNIGRRPGYQSHYNGSWISALQFGAYDFISFYCGKLNVSITGNENLDADMLNIFAQTFVKHFWNTRIGFKRPEDFYVQLSAFLNENLPLWAQFFNEAIYKRGAFITNAGKVFVDASGTLKFEQNSQNTGSNTSATKGSDNTSGHTTSNGETNTTANDESKSNTTGTTSTNSTQKQLNQALDVKTTTPQTAVNYNGDEVAKGNITGIYDFSYADEIDGNFANNNTTNNETSQSDSTTTGTDKQTSNTTNNDETTTTQAGSSTSETVVNNNATQTSSHNQDTQNTSSTSTQARNADVFTLAQGLNGLANGAYLDLFQKAKEQGLFLLTYY